jgi:hypothetical protein
LLFGYLDSQYGDINERKKKDNPIRISNGIIIKDSLTMKKEVNLLNIFEPIQDLQKMIDVKTNKLFTDKDTKKLMSLLKYKRLIKKEVQKINISAFYTTYSLKHALIQKLVRLKMELSKINKEEILLKIFHNSFF